MPTGRVVKHSHDMKVTIKDGSTLDAEFRLWDGETEISALARKLRAVEAYEVRGKLTSVRSTNREYPTFTLTLQMTNFAGAYECDSGTEDATPAEVFNRLGAWSAAVSTLPVCKGGTDVFCVDIEIEMPGTSLGDPDDHEIVLKSVRGVVQASTGQPNTWSIECTVYGDIAGDLAIPEA